MEELIKHTYWRGSMGSDFRKQVTYMIGEMVANYGVDCGGVSKMDLGTKPKVVFADKTMKAVESVSCEPRHRRRKNGGIAISTENLKFRLGDGESCAEPEDISIDGLLEILDAIDLQVYPN